MTRFRTLIGVSLALLAAGCSSLDPATKLTRELLSMPKEDAYARGDAFLVKKKYEQGRQFLRFVAENYANDAIGKQAALRLADSYFDEKTALGYLEAQARYKDFRNRYPSHPRSDYALFRLAQCSDRQAEKPDRDQTNTRAAVNSYRDILRVYPDSPYASEARARLRLMWELLAEHEFRVAHFYFKKRAYAAARGRFETILSTFAEYSGMPQTLYEAGIAESKLGREGDARTLWDKLEKDFPANPLVKKLPRKPKEIVPAPEAVTKVTER